MTEVGFSRTSLFKRLSNMHAVFLSGNEFAVRSGSLFSTEQVEKQVVPLKSSEVYLLLAVKLVDVITKSSP